MDNTRLNPEPLTSSPSRSGRRGSNASNSPEFEFWRIRNSSCPQPALLSADELFVDGVLLPLHLLHLHHGSESDPPEQTPEPTPEEPPVIDPDPGPGPELSAAATDSNSGFSASKRWKDIFKKAEKKNPASSNQEEKEKDKEKKKERKGGTRASSAELNINIWPFSRSRSAGNAGSRRKLFPGARRVNSAPCSRSNSAGESKSRKWPSSPGRPGIYLGRSSPVWQVRRGSSGSKNSESVLSNREKVSKKERPEGHRVKATGGGSSISKASVFNLNVPMCIGYSAHLSCRSDENGAMGINGSGGRTAGSNDNRMNGGGGAESGGASNAGNLFNLRSLFTKKSVLTSH